MRLISHRGNIDGANDKFENSIVQIEKVINSFELDCEIDLRVIGDRLFLGHDHAQEEIELEWLLQYSNYLWIHCKNIDALHFLSSFQNRLNYFWHNGDDYTLTSQGHIWSYPGKKLTSLCVMVLPERFTKIDEFFVKFENGVPFAVCTDHPSAIRRFWENHD